MTNHEQPHLHALSDSMRRAYNSTEQGKLDRLLKEESRWKRKRTIAQNKLDEVRLAIAAEANRLAKLADEQRLGIAKPATDK